MEIYKTIEGFENYQVSNLGNIKSFNYGRENIIKTTKNKFGYLNLTLFKKGKRYYFSVHRLVATTFIQNPENKKQVNHINGVKTDNCVENIEWNTCKENMTHAFSVGLNKGKKGFLNVNSKLNEEDVLFIRSSDLSRKELSVIYNIDKTVICKIINRKSWNHI